MSVPVQISDHTQRGLASLLSQWTQSPRLRALVAILLDRVQEFEDVAYDVMLQRVLDNAEGVWLERLGRSIREPRGPFTDDDEYRRVIKSRAIANVSECVLETYVAIPEILFEPHLSAAEPNVRALQHGHLHVRVEYDVDTDPGDDLRAAAVRHLALAKCGGSSFTLIQVDNGDSFRYDVGPGYDMGTYASVVGHG